MKSRRKEEAEKRVLHRALLTLIAKEIRTARHQWRASTRPDLQDLFQAKVLLLKEVLEVVRGAPPEWAWKQLQAFKRECVLTHRLCRNPGMKIYFRLQVRTVRDLLATVRAAA